MDAGTKGALKAYFKAHPEHYWIAQDFQSVVETLVFLVMVAVYVGIFVWIVKVAFFEKKG